MHRFVSVNSSPRGEDGALNDSSKSKRETMTSRELAKKPLVEAIFEMRWALHQNEQGFAFDPHYRLLLGRLFDRLQSDYGEYQQLEAAQVPDGMAGHIVQHRFRKAKDEWPLVQIGPGILTLNETARYQWGDYRERIAKLHEIFRDAHPKWNDITLENLTLRYIDAVEFDYQTSSIIEFLRENMKVGIEVPSNLFKDSDVKSQPLSLQTQLVYRCTDPAGVIQLKFATGQREGKSALIWETVFQSGREDLPNWREDFKDWLDQSHGLIEDWFFTLIAGKLQEEFSSE